MSKNQTAVEYLVKELSAILGPLETKPMQDLLMVDAINKAKQMEEEQLFEYWNGGMQSTEEGGVSFDVYHNGDDNEK